MFSCTAPHKEVHRLLAEADSLVWTNADSALHLLASLSHPERLEDEPRAHYALLLTQARYRCYIPSVSDSLIDTALEYYRSHPEMADRLAASWYYKGALMKERKAPLDSTITAYKEAEALISQLQDQRLVARIYHSLGQINDGASCYDLAKEYYHKALKVNSAIGNVESQVSNLTNLLGVYLMEDKADSVQWCVDQLDEMSKMIKDTVRLRNLYHNIAVFYKLIHNVSQSDNYYNLALSMSKDSLQYAETLNSLIDLYIYNQEIEKADSINHKLTKNHDLLYYHNSYRIAKKKGDYQKAISLVERYMVICDSVYEDIYNKGVLELQKKYDITNLKYQSAQTKTKWIIITSIILFVTCCIVFYQKHQKNKLFLKFIHLQNELLFHQHHQMEYERLKQELEAYDKKKEKELSGLSNQYLLLLSQKEKQMQSIEYSALKTIRQIIEGYQYNPKTDREIVRYCLSLTHKEFINRLEVSCPNMKNRIVDVCYLTALGMSIADIAILLQVNEKTIKQYMGRVCEEAGFKECGKKQFYIFMTTLLTPQY